MTPAPKIAFICTSCGGEDLELDGWVEASLLCSFTQKINVPARKTSLDIDHSSFRLEDARLSCRQCKVEGKVLCRNEETDFFVELDEDRLRGLFEKTLNFRNIYLSGGDFAEVDWRPDLEITLAAQYPELGPGQSS